MILFKQSAASACKRFGHSWSYVTPWKRWWCRRCDKTSTAMRPDGLWSGRSES